jgi:hypothetical protein
MAQDALYNAYLSDCAINKYGVNPPEAFSVACSINQRIVAYINAPYTGSGSADRLAWLRRRRRQMQARVAIIQGAMTELGAKDVTDTTARTIGGIGGIVAQVGGLIPGVGSIVSLIGTGAQLVAGLFDKTAQNEAARQAELARWQQDLVNLQLLYAANDEEYNSLMLPRYILYGCAVLVSVVALALYLKKRT